MQAESPRGQRYPRDDTDAGSRDQGALRRRRLITLAAASVAVLIVAVVGFVAIRMKGHQPDSTAASSAPATPASAPESGVPAPSTAPPVPVAAAPADLAASFNAMSAPLDATVGLAVTAVGKPGEAMTFGKWTSGAAWSTSKVPLVLAALQQQSAPTVTVAMEAAITRSDNDAAEQVWESLGDPKTAAGKMDAVMRNNGDQTTNVQSEKVRPEFSAFGQTIWSLADQAAFLAHVACDASAGPVLDLMSHVEPDQKWGLGTLPGARFKGGWGPGASAGYLVRQVGLIPTPAGGTVAVAVVADSSSGSFSDGTRDLDTITKWVSSHLSEMPSGTCS